MSNGIILYEGPSLLDNSPIVVIATGTKKVSANDKTGRMVQVFILRSDIEPHEAQKTGDDFGICGDCKHRGPSEADRPCYVITFQGPLSVFRAYKRGKYKHATGDYPLRGYKVRVGAYGDPSAIPYSLWLRLLTGSRGWTGYTHQWQTFPELQGLFMASVDTPAEFEEAAAAGWRCYRSRLPSEPVLDFETMCPATKEAGKLTDCASCLLCDGKNGAEDTRRHMVAIRHGPINKVQAYDRMRERIKSRLVVVA